MSGGGSGARLFGSTRVGRSTLFLWSVAAASLNAFAGIGIRTWTERGPAYAIVELFGVSAVAWMAISAALALLANAGEDEAPRAADWGVAACVAMVSVLPVGTASSGALTFLSLYIIATAARGSPTSRAGIICLAVTGTLLWGRVLLALFSRPLLDIDAWLVGSLFGSHQVGNVISFTDGSGRVIVAPGCSSWQGMSLAILFWATVNQYYGVRFDPRAVATCLLALAATVAVNVLRIGAMIAFPRHLAEIHHGYGWHLSVWASLIAVGTICFLGARREILDL